jgi:hypothetical protein
LSRRIALCAACLLTLAVAGAGLSAPGHSPDERTVSLARAHLCVTEGSATELPGNRLSVNVPKMRAYATVATLQDVTAHFTYFGASAGKEAPLGSGEMRRQFGLKLHAEDACNLVYAMWRIEPESKLVVSVKSNPGQHSSAECGNRGYRNIKARRASAVPALRPGAAHTLRAQMNGQDLKVWVDGNVVWEGPIGSEAQGFNGPVGMRSDNAHLEIELEAAHSGGAEPHYELACRVGETE